MPPPAFTSSPAPPTENVALRGKATQLRRYTHDFGAAYNAIDGNRESSFYMGSCTHSAELENPWWRVDLLDSYVITSISITNRGDCCEHRLDGLKIHIGNSSKNEGLDNSLWVTGRPRPPDDVMSLFFLSPLSPSRYCQIPADKGLNCSV